MKPSRWLNSALSDDTIVASLLLSLKHSSTSPSPLPTWGARQPRSKPSTSSPSTSTPPPPPQLPPQKDIDSRRASPTTPLSWTTSPTRLGSTPSFPKISAASDTPTTSIKRPRRKKTFAELKDEESSLLNERLHLQKELETLHITLKEQRSINANLKRIKLDLHVQSGIKSESNCDLFGPRLASSSTVSRQVKTEDASEHSPLTQIGVSSKQPVFVLPDLNMAPDEECDLMGMS